MAKKKNTPQPEQFEEVAAPDSGSTRRFTTSTPKATSGRITSQEPAAEPASTSEGTSAGSEVDDATFVKRMRGFDALSRELSEVPLGAKKQNSRSSRSSAAKPRIERAEGIDDYTQRILGRMNSDRAASRKKGLESRITKLSNRHLFPLYQKHLEQGGCDETGPFGDKCPTLLSIKAGGQPEDFKTYLKSHGMGTGAKTNPERQAATAAARKEVMEETDPLTGQKNSEYRPITADDLKTSNTAQHLERLYKLADMMHEEHKQRADASGGSIPYVGEDAYHPDKVRSAINEAIKQARGTVDYAPYKPGVGRVIRSAPDQPKALESLPGLALLWTGEAKTTEAHQNTVNGLWSAMSKIRSRNAQKSNPGSDIGRQLSTLGGESRRIVENAYDAETAKHNALAPIIDTIHKILGAGANQSRQLKTAETARTLKAMSNEEAREQKETIKSEYQEIVPRISGPEIQSNVDIALQEAHSDHESQHVATRRANLAALGKRGSATARASARFDTCDNPECNSARRSEISAAAEQGLPEPEGLSFEKWQEIHKPDVGTGIPELSAAQLKTVASENRRRVAVAISPRTPTAVGDILTQNSNTAEGAGTETPDNNADDAVDRLSNIQSQVASGAILLPGSSRSRSTGRGRGSQPETLKPILNRNISEEHFDIWKSMPRKVQQSMLSYGIKHGANFVNSYRTHLANEKSKVAAAQEIGKTYKPAEFTFTP